jgi:hypothetical protein
MVDIKEILKRSQHFNKHVFKKKNRETVYVLLFKKKTIFSYSIKKNYVPVCLTKKYNTICFKKCLIKSGC